MRVQGYDRAANGSKELVDLIKKIIIIYNGPAICIYVSLVFLLA